MENKIPFSNRDPLTYINKSNQHSIYLQSVEIDEIINEVKVLKNASSGCDVIHSKIVRLTYPLYIKPLQHVLNLSITQGFFPTELKVAKVVPICKNGDITKFSNYRPVSILPLFSKILERLMYSYNL